MNYKIIFNLLFVFGLLSCTTNAEHLNDPKYADNFTTVEGLETITFGAGCFWCVEAVFQEVKGVTSAVSGYAGGHVKNVSYKEVCSGTTGHAEVVKVTFDPEIISLDEILEIFWKTHDPTTLNRQGADVGTQYRSAVFYHNDAQKKAAEAFLAKLKGSGYYANPIVTEITALNNYYEAEGYHQDYFALNHSKDSYCRVVIQPKLDKFRKQFKDKLK